MKKFWVILTSLTTISTPLVFLNHAYAQSTQSTNSDALILRMEQAYRKKDQITLDNLLPKVSQNPLASWGAYWQLDNRLKTASPTEINDFFKKYPDTYVADNLRGNWLSLLGQAQDWKSFLQVDKNYLMKNNTEVACYRLLANYELNRQDISQDFLPLWFSLKTLSPGCLTTADTLYNHDQMPVSAIWLKIRDGMDVGNWGMVKNATALISPKLVPQVIDIYQEPERFLEGKIIALTPKTKELTVLALVRLSRTNYSLAQQYMTKLRWRVQLKHADMVWIWGAIGKRATQNFDPDALKFYAHDKLSEISPDHLPWMVRAALLKGNWPLVLRAIDAMPKDMSKDPKWVYWKAIAIDKEVTGEDKTVDHLIRSRSEKLLRTITDSTSYYGLLALHALNEKITIPQQPTTPTFQEMREVAHNVNLSQAIYGYHLGLRSEATRSWDFATNFYANKSMKDNELLAAAKTACQKEIWIWCINTSNRTKSFIDMNTRYPTPFKVLVTERSKEIGLNPSFVYGLIRQESRFIIAAQSSVGAQGLMQVMPTTAHWTANKLGIKDFRLSQMSQESTNIAIGTGYLKLVFSSLESSYPLTAAAYNAGPRRPVQWSTAINNPDLEGSIWVESIPFAETRDYVEKVLANTVNYSMILNRHPISINHMLTHTAISSTADQAAALKLP